MTTTSRSVSEAELVKALDAFARALVSSQEDLPVDAQRILDANRWELYGDDEPERVRDWPEGPR